MVLGLQTSPFRPPQVWGLQSSNPLQYTFGASIQPILDTSALGASNNLSRSWTASVEGGHLKGGLKTWFWGFKPAHLGHLRFGGFKVATHCGRLVKTLTLNMSEIVSLIASCAALKVALAGANRHNDSDR